MAEVPNAASPRRQARPSETSRPSWWAVGAVVAIWLATVCTLHSGLLGAAPAEFFENVTEAAAAMAAFVAAALRSRRVAGRGRPAWRLLAAYAGLWSAGQWLWTWQAEMGHGMPFPSPADIGFLAAVPFALAAMACMPVGRSGAGSPLRVGLDGGITAVWTLFVGWAVVIGPVWRAGVSSGAAVALSVVYPVFDVVILTAAVALVARAERHYRTGVALLTGSLAFIAVADANFSWVAAGGVETSAVGNSAWTLGFLLLALAALHWPPRAEEGVLTEQPSASMGAGAVYAPVLIAVGVMAFLLSGGRPLDPVLIWIGLMGFLMVIVRQWFTTVDVCQRERDLHGQAFYDSLTGLANRRLLLSRLDQRLDAGVPTGLLLFDLDNFKVINDSFGHAAGDLVLGELAERVRRSCRPDDLAARLGGDEFAVLLADVANGPQAIAVAHRLRAEIRRPLSVDGLELLPTVSIGLAVAGAGAVTPTAGDLLRNADLAMYAAKRNGRDGYEIYEPTMQADAMERIALSADLQRALEREEFTLHFQPKVDMRTGRIEGAEALVRWEHPTRGVISPVDFIPIAEESGAIIVLGQWILDSACRTASGWMRSGHIGRDFDLCVNISARQFRDPQLVGCVRAALDDTGWLAANLIIEVTESFLADPVDATAVLMVLKGTGVRLAIDDFGTGYSSLNYLQQFPVDILKVDRAFVAGVDRGHTQAALCRSIIRLADALGLATVAEGVERWSQASALIELGCTSAQGFLYSQPVSSREFAGLLVAERSLEAGRRALPA